MRSALVRLSSKDHRFSCCSLHIYGSSLAEGIILVNLLCTFFDKDFILLVTTNKVTKATGNSRSGIPGNRGPLNSRREFPGISEILGELWGIYRSFVFFSNVVADFDILVFNLTQQTALCA